jgi:leader peptidase (prepilin peptidase) / N-methyltransferase
LAVARHLPPGRHRAGDRHLNFYDSRDNLALAVPGALGAADVRLAGLLGLALGWPGWTTVISGAMLGLLYGSLTGATMIVLRRATRHTHIPFGPALIAGAFTALLVTIG